MKSEYEIKEEISVNREKKKKEKKYYKEINYICM